MNDKDKERLHEMLHVACREGEFFEGRMIIAPPGEMDQAKPRKVHEKWDKFRTMLSSLIDRQPGEEEAKNAMHILASIKLSCSSWRGCSTCTIKMACLNGFETIRKALGVKE